MVFDAQLEANQCQVVSQQLNTDQRRVFVKVKKALETNQQWLGVVEGLGGTGKTFLYKAICHLVRGRNEIILPTAWTGIAAALLIGGQT